MEITKCLLATFLFYLGCYCVSGAPRWCAQNEKNQRKCVEIARLTGKITCIMGAGEKDCYEKIANGLADLSIFDGGSIYHAGETHGLKVIMSERLKGTKFGSLVENGTKYFGVAVVKASSTLTFNTLKGAKSCHTGVQKSSGWIIPVGKLLAKGGMLLVNNDQYASVGSFFSASCAPGANSTRYNEKLLGLPQLCALCRGNGNAKCARNGMETYYGYQGAFRCLKDGAGDVAFIKQSILTSLSPSEQAKYKLLCLDNTRKDPKDFATCNLAGAAAHAVLTSAETSEATIAEYQELLELADRTYGVKSENPFKIYDGSIFSSSAIGFDKVPVDRRAYNQYLDPNYIDAISKLEPSSSSSDSKSAD